MVPSTPSAVLSPSTNRQQPVSSSFKPSNEIVGVGAGAGVGAGVTSGVVVVGAGVVVVVVVVVVLVVEQSSCFM